MKTPKEKAMELVDKYLYCTTDNYGFEYSKKCAIIAVDEIIDLYKRNWNIESGYWNEVKKQIEKL